MVVLACVLGVRPLAAQEPRVFADVLVGVMAPVPGSFAIPADVPARDERAQFVVSVDPARALVFELGGGVRLAGPLSVGVAWTRGSADAAGSMRITIPHPIEFNRPASDTAATLEPLTRRDEAFHLEAMGEWQVSPRVAVRVFGGPSRVQVTQDVVDGIDYDETIAADRSFAVDITGNTVARVETSAWGFHAGGAVAATLARHFGAIGLVRFTRATVALPNPIQSAFDGSDVTVEVHAGGLALCGGLTFRF